MRKSNGTLYWYGTGSDALDETDASGNLANEYIFFGGKRIARRDASSNIFYYFTDHLGTPRSIVQAGQTTPWKLSRLQLKPEEGSSGSRPGLG